MQEKEAVWQEIRNRVFQNMDLSGDCLLYTSDAADD